MDAFTTREVASAFWTLILLLWALSRRETRASLLAVVRSATHWKLVLPAVLLAAYTAGVVAILYQIGYWRADLLKDTLLWFAFSGLAITFSFGGKRADDNFFRKTILDQLKVVIVLEYLVNTYTFALPVELVLLPVLVFLGMLAAVASFEPKYGAVGQVISSFEVLFGLAVLATAVMHAVSEYSFYRTSAPWRELALAPILSILMVPYAYALHLVIAYEQLFLRLRMALHYDPQVARYARKKLFKKLGLRLRRVRAFTGTNAVELIRLRTTTDVDNLFLARNRPDSGLSS